MHMINHSTHPGKRYTRRIQIDQEYNHKPFAQCLPETIELVGEKLEVPERMVRSECSSTSKDYRVGEGVVGRMPSQDELESHRCSPCR